MPRSIVQYCVAIHILHVGIAWHGFSWSDLLEYCFCDILSLFRSL